MGRIRIDTNCNAPCPCLIRELSTRRTILVQRDYDYPGFASTFGWTINNVQRCTMCNRIVNVKPHKLKKHGAKTCACSMCGKRFDRCYHTGTDGTLECKLCGIMATEFINFAHRFLLGNHGATADDPGYFN